MIDHSGDLNKNNIYKVAKYTGNLKNFPQNTTPIGTFTLDQIINLTKTGINPSESKPHIIKMAWNSDLDILNINETALKRSIEQTIAPFPSGDKYVAINIKNVETKKFSNIVITM